MPDERTSESARTDGEDSVPVEDQETSLISRRTMLELTGLGVAGSAFATGIASAHTSGYTEADDQEGTSASPAELVDRMDLSEKVRTVHGHVGAGPDVSIGYVAPNDRLNIPDLCLADGPVGVRHPMLYDGTEVDVDTANSLDSMVLAGLSGGPSTAFPSGISQAATWNTDSINDVGFAMGREAKAKGQDVLLAPAFNIGRVPTCGRNFEYFGEDPYLAGRGAIASVDGIQSTGTVATVKHYVANNQERNRMSVSADVGERALREIYLPAFRAAVEEANVGSVMAAYNRVNGTYCTEHRRLLTDILKGEWNFDGYVVSDWTATQSTVAAANAGLDLEMMTGQHFGSDLQTAVENGEVSMAVLDDKVRRILGQSDRIGVLDGDREGPPGAANTTEHQQLARHVAAEGGVLLKNESPGLPIDLDAVDTIAVIGKEADEAKVGGGGSSNVKPPYSVSPLAGIRNAADAETTVTYASGDLVEDAVTAAKAADVAIVFAHGSSTEGRDRDDLVLDDDQNELIASVADANAHTAVVLNTGGPVVMPWVDDVPAILEMWYPGMEDGNATADVLFGATDPGGKLPVTFGKRWEDYPVASEGQYPGVDQGDGYPVAEYSEGIYVGYRHFDEHGIEPLFPFGHGESYTDFAFTDVDVPSSAKAVDGVPVSVTVENTGERHGTETVQVYVHEPKASVDRPPKELEAFEKVSLSAGEQTTVALTLDRDAFTYYDADDGAWVLDSGQFDLLVGSSSRDIRLEESVVVTD